MAAPQKWGAAIFLSKPTATNIMRYLPFMFLCLSVLLSGCATTQNHAETKTLPEGIYEVQTGQQVTYKQLVTRLNKAAFVVVGEMHTDVWHHQIQAQILKSLSALNPSLALGMEMFQRPFQTHLDDYVAGRIDETQMLQRTEYAKRWGFNTGLYAPLWRTAQNNNTPIIALNAPKAWTRQTARVGVAQLPEAIKSQLPELDLSSTAHRKWMKTMFAAHGATMKDRVFERFYEAQVIWDETMADSAYKALQQAQISQVMIVAGSGHVLNRYGIPSRIERRLGPNARNKVVTLIPQSRKRPLTKKILSDYARDQFADFIWVRYIKSKSSDKPSPH